MSDHGQTDVAVPVIDVASFIEGTDRVTAPAQISRAMATSGFFQIVGHGIPAPVIDQAFTAARHLSELPAEAKSQLGSPTGHPYRGLMTNYDTSGHLCSEGFTVSRFEDAQDAEAHGVPAEFSDFFVANVWPDIDGFRPAMIDLSIRTRALGRTLMQCFAVALGHDGDFFDASTELDASTSTIRSYPARNAAPPADPTVIFDEHFDGGVLTMLQQRGTYEGLEIRTLQGDWFAVPVIADAFVINIGELMTRWTNGRWPSTRHRVVAAQDPAGYRFTLPTFYMPAVQTVVAPLADGNPPAFEPVTVYDWLTRHIKRSYQERTHTTTTAATEAFVATLSG
jgi:isopenicillin N synthase-like dioxygenase